MDVKIRSWSDKRLSKLEAEGEIKEILINENLMDPKGEKISLCFRGRNSSGIIELTADEVDRILTSAGRNLHLVQGHQALIGERGEIP